MVVAEQNLVSSHPRLRGHGNGPRRAALCDRDPRMRKSSSTPAGGWRAYILVLLKGLLMYLKLDSSNYPHRRAGLVGRRVGGGGGAHYLLGFTVCLRVICELWCVVNELPSGMKGRICMYVLYLCVRHGPHACLARWLHEFRPGVDPGYGDSDPCL